MYKFNSILKELQDGDKHELYSQLMAIDASINCVIESPLVVIENHDPSLFSIWEREGLNTKIVTYLLHYILPLNEILISKGKHNIQYILAAELLGFIAWRTFDNCVDGHDLSKAAHLSSLASCMRYISFSQSYYPSITVDGIYHHYKVMAEQSLQEVEQPVALNNIWKRCSIVFHAIETLAEVDEKSVSLFKSYINYTGLAHDMSDIVNDLTSHIVSLPVYWLLQDNAHGIINAESIENLYSKAKIEIKPIEDSFITLKVRSYYPLMGYLLSTASTLFHKNKPSI